MIVQQLWHDHHHPRSLHPPSVMLPYYRVIILLASIGGTRLLQCSSVLELGVEFHNSPCNKCVSAVVEIPQTALS
jgi:hypothetical protein